MLRINKVEIKGFGPYINQSVKFENRPGVNIIWGDNGFGKTTFINALKFGFYGELPDENDRDKSIISLINVHNKRRNEYNFNVIIDFEIEKDRYTLTRFGQPKFNNVIPETYNDFDIGLHLQKNENLLAPNEARLTLNRIMPENTSRFFIFDGELLEEYNNLAEESQSSLKLKESIEQILGLPIISNGRRHIDTIKGNISEQLIQLNREQNQEKKNYRILEKEKETLDKRERELKKLIEKRDEFQEEHDDAYEQLKKGPSGIKLEKYEKLSRKLKEIESQIDAKNELIKDLVLTSWKGLTHQRLVLFRMETNKKIADFENLKQEYDVGNNKLNTYKLSMSKLSCETCHRTLHTNEIEEMKKKIKEIEDKTPKITVNDRSLYENNKRSVDIINNKLIHLKTDETKIATYIKEILDLEVEVYTIKTNMDDIQKSIDNFSNEREDNILLEAKRKKALENLGNASNSIRELEEEIKKTHDNIRNLENNIKESINDEVLNVYKEKENILEDLSSLLEESIDIFREELRFRVQKDAESLFVKFSNQKDFTGLKINDNYGLDIIHSSGEIVPVKSSGYSHIVSLCLIGALHKNAPVQGPVFIDSPSGRLDQNHKNNLINILTAISDQVVLLLYNGELDVQLIRKNLKSSLIGEFELIHVNDDAFTTVIKER